jgi:hypothetical protein
MAVRGQRPHAHEVFVRDWGMPASEAHQFACGDIDGFDGVDSLRLIEDEGFETLGEAFRADFRGRADGGWFEAGPPAFGEGDVETFCLGRSD